MDPIAVDLRQPAVEIWNPDLCAQQPQRPCWNYVQANFRTEPRVNGEGPIGRKEAHQKTDQADQVEVIKVTRLVQQEKVCESKKEYGRSDAVKKPGHHASSSQT